MNNEADSNKNFVLTCDFVDLTDASQTEEYKRFVQSHRAGGITQSPEWCKVKHNWKHEAIVVRNDKNAIIASMLILIKKIPGLCTNFLYSPRGPVCDFRNKAVLSKLMDSVKVIAKKYNAYIFKCDPYIEDADEKSIAIMRELGFNFTPKVPETHTIQSRCNYILDIENKTEEEVFNSFHSKWRYNIRLAIRKGVTCSHYGTEKIDDFYGLMRETAARHNFALRAKEYFVRMMESLGPYCRLYMCYYNGQPLSGAIAVQYAGKTCYIYGASASAHSGLMPSYLMQWTMIKWAIENNNYLYDFQGIPFYYDENHPNYGVYRFKKGFNGQVIEYAGEFDYVFMPFRKILAECSIKGYAWILNLLPKLQANK